MVWRWPDGPKSSAWLFARFITSNPALANTPAYEDGAWKAKQFGLPPPHFDGPPEPRVPSRFPTVIWLDRSRPATDPNTWRPPLGGRPWCRDREMSPTQVREMAGAGGAAATAPAHANAATAPEAPTAAALHVPHRRTSPPMVPVGAARVKARLA